MPELNDILAAFELTLNLERELGTNVLEFVRSMASNAAIWVVFKIGAMPFIGTIIAYIKIN